PRKRGAPRRRNGREPDGTLPEVCRRRDADDPNPTPRTARRLRREVLEKLFDRPRSEVLMVAVITVSRFEDGSRAGGEGRASRFAGPEADVVHGRDAVVTALRGIEKRGIRRIPDAQGEVSGLFEADEAVEDRLDARGIGDLDEQGR